MLSDCRPEQVDVKVSLSPDILSLPNCCKYQGCLLLSQRINCQQVIAAGFKDCVRIDDYRTVNSSFSNNCNNIHDLRYGSTLNVGCHLFTLEICFQYNNALIASKECPVCTSDAGQLQHHFRWSVEPAPTVGQEKAGDISSAVTQEQKTLPVSHIFHFLPPACHHFFRSPTLFSSTLFFF